MSSFNGIHVLQKRHSMGRLRQNLVSWSVIRRIDTCIPQFTHGIVRSMHFVRIWSSSSDAGLTLVWHTLHCTARAGHSISR